LIKGMIDKRLQQRINLRWELNHLSLGNVLLNTRLERCLARVDRDFFAIRSNSCDILVLCVRRHCVTLLLV
jgi:hypothetical protein